MHIINNMSIKPEAWKHCMKLGNANKNTMFYTLSVTITFIAAGRTELLTTQCYCNEKPFSLFFCCFFVSAKEIPIFLYFFKWNILFVLYHALNINKLVRALTPKVHSIVSVTNNDVYNVSGKLVLEYSLNMKNEAKPGIKWQRNIIFSEFILPFMKILLKI